MSPTELISTQTLRHGDPAYLANALAQARDDSLRLFAAFEQHLPRGTVVAFHADVNPPLWELGHVGWFEESWLARNPLRGRWRLASDVSARAASCLPRADALYDSSHVAHTRRWHIDLPDAQHTRHYLAAVRERSLALLQEAAHDDDGLYFFRLVLAHEDMHAEAAIYTAQHLALPFAAALHQRAPLANRHGGEVSLPGGLFMLGNPEAGFSFDNELGAHEMALPGFTIDRAPVSWERYLPFIEAGGYDDKRWWSDEGFAWRRKHSNGRPRHLRHDDDGHWQQANFAEWLPLDMAAPAMHLTQHEARAWCAFSGRRLPSEAEWECAATTQPEDFDWGQVWEWTASAFAPYPGFVAHPYRDYSAPWFDGRPVLRGASFATTPRMKHPRYRNYYTAERNDIFAGFRSCAL